MPYGCSAPRKVQGAARACEVGSEENVHREIQRMGRTQYSLLPADVRNKFDRQQLGSKSSGQAGATYPMVTI